jgi:mRNA interferase MazF
LYFTFYASGFCYPIKLRFASDTEDEEKQVIPGRTIPASMHTYEFLDKDSMIQCEEIRAVSKARLDANRGCIGTLTPEDFDLVKGKFKRAYNL